jgi:riboflavin synthase
MFTGIIETIGRIQHIRKTGEGRQFTIIGGHIADSLKLGDSVSVNGCCLTVVSIDGQNFTVDAVETTLRKSAIGMLHPGDEVNLERAMRSDGRLDGHIVQGHVDCTVAVESVSGNGKSSVIQFKLPTEFEANIVEAGSVAVDGVSLTVASLSVGNFAVAVVPHTLKSTILHLYKPGRIVNIEWDVLGKYVLRAIDVRHSKKGMSGTLLSELGY